MFCCCFSQLAKPRRSQFSWSPDPFGRMSSGPEKVGTSGDGNGDKKPEKKPEKSYLASAVESINPWTGRSTTPAPKDNSSLPQPKPTPLSAQKADDHSTNHLYGLSFKKYPSDCPPMNVLWFHAVDVCIPEPLRVPAITDLLPRSRNVSRSF